MSAKTLACVMIVAMLLPALANAVVVTPIYNSSFNDTEKACIADAIKEWTDLLGGNDGFYETIHFICDDNLVENTGGHLGETSDWYFTSNGRPTSATITIDNKHHNWTMGPPITSRYDALNTLKHEVAHALGFTHFSSAFASHTITDAAGILFYDLNHDGIFNNSDLRLADPDHTYNRGLMYPSSNNDPINPASNRNHPTPELDRILRDACGYALTSVPDGSGTRKGGGANPGSWRTPNEWYDSLIADGIGARADFSDLDVPTSGITIYIDTASQTIGSLIFGDADNSTIGIITIAPESPGNALNLAVTSGSPTITVYQGTSAAISASVTGSNGMTKNGWGTLILSGANTYNGITLISEGTLRTGNTAALGSTVAGTTVADGATLDVNNQNLGTEAITVQGAGVGGNGTIVNNNAAGSTTALNALRYVTLTGDTYFGGTNSDPTLRAYYGRWDIRGTGAYLSTGGNSYNITKVGNNQVSLAGVAVDTALANINVNQGIFSLETTSTLGDPSKTVTVDGSMGTPGTLNSATLQFYNLSTPLNKNIVLQNGGSIYARSNSATTNNTVAGAITIADTGGILNAGGIRSDNTAGTPSTTMTINGAISGSSSAVLTKEGPGTVILNASNTFSGATNLNNGTMIVNGTLPTSSLTMSITGTGTTTLAGTGTITGNVSDNTGTSIAPGATGVAGSVGTLNFGGNLSLGALGTGKLAMDLSNNTSSGNDLINLTNSSSVLSLSNTTEINVNELYGPGSLANGTYRLINYAGSLTGSAAANLTVTGVTADTRNTYTPNDSTPNQINLVVAGSPLALVWKGDGSSNMWDVKTTLNWNNNTEIFYNLDSVTFDDTGDTSADIYLYSLNASQSVSPSSVTVNSSKNYTFGGFAKITGATGITKFGTGTLILHNAANDYTGSTTINAGKLQVGDGLTSGIRLGTGPIVNNAALVLNNPAGDDYTISSVISGSGSMEQKGSNTITLSAANTYTGLTTITSGTIKAGNTAAFGSTVAGTTVADGATLDLNGINLSTEAITVQGAGVGGNGAIINNGASQTNALKLVTLSDNITFGGSGRWDIRGTGATLSTGGSGYSLTKVGTNQISLVSTTVDTALGALNINQGILSFQMSTSSMGDPSKIVTIASGAILGFSNKTAAMNKKAVLNGGTIWAESGTGTNNTFAGPITINSTGAIFDAGGGLTGGTANGNAVMTLSGAITGAGGVTKNGPGTVFITGTPGYSGNTTVSAGTLQINTGSAVALHSVAGAGTLGVGNTTTITVDSINIGTLTISAGSKLTIAPLPGGPLAGAGSLSAVPEPSTWAMLVLAAMGLGIYRSRAR